MFHHVFDCLPSRLVDFGKNKNNKLPGRSGPHLQTWFNQILNTTTICKDATLVWSRYTFFKFPFNTSTNFVNKKIKNWSSQQ